MAERLSQLSRIPAAFESVKKDLWYPSNKSCSDVLRSSAVISVGLVVAMQNGLPKRYGIPALVATWIPELIQNDRYHQNSKYINSLFIFQQTSSPLTVDLGEGTHVQKGDMIGEIHLRGADKKPKWRDLSPIERGRRMTRAAIDGLDQLAIMCKRDYPEVQGISVFHGRSDLIPPHLLRGIGFIVEESPEDSLGKEEIKIRQMRAMGLGCKKEEVTIGKMYDVWFTRDMLIAAQERIVEYGRRISRNLSNSTIMELYTDSDKDQESASS